MGKLLYKDRKLRYSASARSLVSDGNGTDCCCGGGGCDPVRCCDSPPFRCGHIPINCPCVGSGCQYGPVVLDISISGLLSADSFQSGNDTVFGWDLNLNFQETHSYTPTANVCRYTKALADRMYGPVRVSVTVVFDLQNNPLYVPGLGYPETCGPGTLINSTSGVFISAQHTDTSGTFNNAILSSIMVASKADADWAAGFKSGSQSSVLYQACSCHVSGGKGSCKKDFSGLVRAVNQTSGFGSNSCDLASSVRAVQGVGSCENLPPDTTGGGFVRGGAGGSGRSGTAEYF